MCAYVLINQRLTKCKLIPKFPFLSSCLYNLHVYITFESYGSYSLKHTDHVLFNGNTTRVQPRLNNDK